MGRAMSIVALLASALVCGAATSASAQSDAGGRELLAAAEAAGGR